MRSLAIALDVGTTFSGVSYAILEPGEVPKIHGVTRYVLCTCSRTRVDFLVGQIPWSGTCSWQLQDSFCYVLR